MNIGDFVKIRSDFNIDVRMAVVPNTVGCDKYFKICNVIYSSIDKCNYYCLESSNKERICKLNSDSPYIWSESMFKKE